MQDPLVQEPTPSHEEWGSWGDGEGAEAEDEGAAGEGSSSASKSVYQRGMTRLLDRLELQHRALIVPDGEK